MTDKFSSSFCGFLSYLFMNFFVKPSASLRPTKADRRKERKPRGLRFFFFFLIGWTCTMLPRPLQRLHSGECGCGEAAFDEAVRASARRVASFSWQRRTRPPSSRSRSITADDDDNNNNHSGKRHDSLVRFVHSLHRIFSPSPQLPPPQVKPGLVGAQSTYF